MGRLSYAMGFFPGAEAPGTGDMHDHCLPHPALLGEAAAWGGGSMEQLDHLMSTTKQAG